MARVMVLLWGYIAMALCRSSLTPLPPGLNDICCCLVCFVIMPVGRSQTPAPRPVRRVPVPPLVRSQTPVSNINTVASRLTIIRREDSSPVSSLYIPPFPPADPTGAPPWHIWGIAKPVFETHGIHIPGWNHWPADQTWSDNVIRARRVLTHNHAEDVVVKAVARNSTEYTVLTNLEEAKNRATLACPPILNFIAVTSMPDVRFVVMPPLIPLRLGEMRTVGDALDFVSQMLKAVAFLHERKISHGDIRTDNIMVLPPEWAGRMTPTESHLPSTLQYTYCLIDYSFSHYLQADDVWWTFSTLGPTVVPPEVVVHRKSGGRLGYDPAAADIWMMSRMLKFDLIYSKANLRILTYLANVMGDDEPRGRFTAAEACTEFDDTLRKLKSTDYSKSILRPNTSTVHMGSSR
ncbi:hypothetical protein CALCODRAFT_556225 [Calocera cornea HHB12733]|uniref:Protein kinase domain-containing protein n=1 Tax=Calocera cornea HHB12733 TaxID=1353952 RepID=A0A165EYH7_9BASI|nr:hypothetical protein CALCODRAFT_556225 [Calocera cornea HHB12733]